MGKNISKRNREMTHVRIIFHLFPTSPSALAFSIP